MLDRRSLLGAGLALLLWPRSAWPQAEPLRSAGFVLPEATRRALEKSPFVYVSPLRSDGRESTCHGEVWYAWLDGAVHLTTARSSWKGRALARGLDRARLWVGDHGRWKRWYGHDEAFRKGPSWLARAREVPAESLLDRLLATYDRKYPEEIGRWRDRMRQGHASGARVLIRYEAIAG